RGERHGTLFEPGEKLRGHKHWLAFTAKSRGRLVLDPGAVRALCERGRSLLPAVILRVEGEFRIGESVTCVDDRGREVARGLVGYSSLDVARLAGQRTIEIERVLGYSNGDEIIHRDVLVLLRHEPDRTSERRANYHHPPARRLRR